MFSAPSLLSLFVESEFLLGDFPNLFQFLLKSIYFMLDFPSTDALRSDY